MNVTRQEVNAETALLTVQVSPADYQGKVTVSLDKYRKQAKIPGFRPGKVPMALVQKQYGKAVLAEEMNKLVSDALYAYVQENKLEILGNPIPKDGTDVKGDFDNPGDFEFVYEIGYSPAIDLKLSSKSKYDYVKVKIDDKLIDQQIDDLRRRYGKMSSAEEVNDTDMILAQFVELNEDGSVKEGGIMHSSTTSMEFVEDKKVKKSLAGKKVGDKVTVSATAITRGDSDKAAMLGIKPEELANHSDSYQMTVNDIKRMELAELNQDLFDKLFGPGAVSSEIELRERIANDLIQMFSNDSDRLLTREVYRDLVENTPVSLPNDFLKRWIQLSNEKQVTIEQIEADYDSYAKDLKWQLIQGHIFKANDIKLDNAEVIQFTKGLIANQYAQYGIPAPEDAELTKQAAGALQNRDEANRIYDMLAEAKLTEYFKNTVKLNSKEVSYDEFVEMASK
ncbi:trigger factor [Fluviicola sp.]|jgi:trigger factor|uniref:trigger factor n=1 Tax=Fluviicola sp. TaxID=1917219 RepID=UPI0028207E99|nr:trigger factor [Fluviicola sp.]MDR0802532.1 trigger factor [Fluviicola sp.]